LDSKKKKREKSKENRQTKFVENMQT